MRLRFEQRVAFLSGLPGLQWLNLSRNQLTNLALPNGLNNLIRLDGLHNPLTYLGVIESLRSQLEIIGFPFELVDFVPDLRIGPAKSEAGGSIRLLVSGRSGQRVRLQRSSNLVDWEDWQTMTLGGDGCGFIDTTTAAPARFYRAVEDTVTAVNEP